MFGKKALQSLYCTNTKKASCCASRSGCTGELTLYPPRRKTFRLASANIVQERVYRRNSILRHITSFYMRSKREKGILQQQPSYSAFFRDPLANAHSTGIILWFPCLAFLFFTLQRSLHTFGNCTC